MMELKNLLVECVMWLLHIPAVWKITLKVMLISRNLKRKILPKFCKATLPELTMFPKMTSKADPHLNVQNATKNLFIIWDTGKKYNYFLYKNFDKWYFSSLGVTDKTFQLARSIFSFHVEMFLILSPKLARVAQRKKIINEFWLQKLLWGCLCDSTLQKTKKIHAK